MELSKESIEKLASLAHLALKDEEKELYRKQMSSILEYVGTLNEVTEHTQAALSGTESVNVLREDEVVRNEETSHQAILANFPDRIGNLLRVPAVFAETETSEDI